jgi:carbamoyl-phosphate synthase large subunit
MASTGEVASFGRDIHEAYWASLLSTTGFKVPRERSGVLIGGDTRTPEMRTIATTLSNLGFRLFCSSLSVESSSTTGHVSEKRIFFPTKDKRKLREVFDEHDIQCVINLARGRGNSVTDEDYVARRYVDSYSMLHLRIWKLITGEYRNAVDFGLPLLNNPRTAQLFVDSLAKKMPQGGLRKYVEGRIPSEVKSWREFIGFRG